MTQRHLTVVKANTLVEATYHLTLAEQRLLLLVIAKLDSKRELEPRISHTITAKEVATTFEVTDARAYQILEEAAQRLYERSVTIYAPDPDKPKSNKLVTRWVASVLYQPQSGAVALTFAPAILPFISQLKARFCRYHLSHIVQMTSIYAVRIYEMLIQWRDAKTRTVELDWLRERLVLDKKYSNIRDLKRFVIEPAIEQINTHSDLWAKWEQVKTGRRVTAIIFHFGLKELTTLIQETKSSAPPERPKLTKEFIGKHALPGESWEDATARLRAKHGYT